MDVDGLTCNGCVRKLTSALEDGEGITSATVVGEPRSHASIDGTLGVDAVLDVIRAAGFEPSSAP